MCANIVSISRVPFGFGLFDVDIVVRSVAWTGADSGFDKQIERSWGTWVAGMMSGMGMVTDDKPQAGGRYSLRYRPSHQKGVAEPLREGASYWLAIEPVYTRYILRIVGPLTRDQ